MAAQFPVQLVPGVLRAGAAVSQQPSVPKPAASLLERLATEGASSLLRLVRNQRLDVTRHMVLERVRVMQIRNNNLPEVNARVYVNESKDVQLLRFKFERTGGGVPPLGDSLLFLMSRYDDPTTWAPAGPKRPILGWPLDHMDERLLLLRPQERVYACQHMWGPFGFLYWSVLDSNDPSLVR